MTHLVRVILLLTVFLIPTLPATSQFGYEQIKVLVFISLISLASIFWMLDKGKKKDQGWIRKMAGVFLLCLGFTSVLGIDPKLSFLGTPPYFQGFILYAYLYLFFILVSSSKIKVELWAKVLIASAFLVSFIAIKDWILLNLLDQQVPTYAGRVVSTFGQPNFYAGFLLLTLPFAYRLGRLGLLVGLVSFIGIFISYSRSTILIALFLLILALIDQLRIKLRMTFLVLMVIFISLFIGLKFSSGIVGNEISNPMLTKNPDLTKESIEKRVYIWPIAFKLILQKPLEGYGLENIGSAFAKYFKENKHQLFEENLNISPILISLKELSIDRSHNYILDLLLFSGSLGLLSYLGLLSLLLSSSRGKNVLMTCLLVYLVWIQFQNQSIIHLVYFYLLAGLIDNVDKPYKV